MKILWHSNAPWANSGYGKQTRLFLPQLRSLGHEVAASANWGLSGSIMEWNGITVYPADEMWGNRLLKELVDHYKADLMIALMDAWLFDTNMLDKIEVPKATWVPVDHKPIPSSVLHVFQETNMVPIAMSKFGQKEFKDKDIESLYVPHAVNTKLYKPLNIRAELRKEANIPEDAFVVGMVAQNRGTSPPRKAFPQVLEAFSHVEKRIPNAYLYMHTNLVAQHHQGINMIEIIQALDIPAHKIVCPSPIHLELSFKDEQLVGVYNLFDVLVCPSYGEGFGIPIIEAQACGVPVIVNDWTSMPELCGAGWKIGGDHWYDTAMRSYYRCPSIGDLEMAMMEAYENRGRLQDKARHFAKKYDVDLVTEKYWKPALARLLQAK